MSLKDAMEQAWRMRGVASPIRVARWRRKFNQEQGELRLEAKTAPMVAPIRATMWKDKPRGVWR